MDNGKATIQVVGANKVGSSPRKKEPRTSRDNVEGVVSFRQVRDNLKNTRRASWWHCDVKSGTRQPKYTIILVFRWPSKVFQRGLLNRSIGYQLIWDDFTAFQKPLGRQKARGISSNKTGQLRAARPGSITANNKNNHDYDCSSQPYLQKRPSTKRSSIEICLDRYKVCIQRTFRLPLVLLNPSRLMEGGMKTNHRLIFRISWSHPQRRSPHPGLLQSQTIADERDAWGASESVDCCCYVRGEEYKPATIILRINPAVIHMQVLTVGNQPSRQQWT